MGSATSYCLLPMDGFSAPRAEFCARQVPGIARRIASTLGQLGHFAYRRRRLLAMVAGLVAVAAALGGRTVFDNVKPFGFQDPSSGSSRAYHALRDATGQ